jgi:hypothetical protein
MSKPNLFDQITLTLARPIGRRRAVRLVAGTLMAGAASFLWPKRALASMICLDQYDDLCAQPGAAFCNNKKTLCCPKEYFCCTKGLACNCCYSMSEKCMADGTCA